MNWRLIAIPASIVPFIILFVTTKVSPQDVFAVGLVPFIISSCAALTRIMLQALRFRYFIRMFIGRHVSTTAKTITARLAGEFVTSTTPSYVGGEFIRIAWLAKQGVPTGKAAWITTMEIIADVFVGSMLAFIAGAFAIYRGGTVIGITVILVTIPTFSIWLAFVLLSARRTLQLPAFVLNIMLKFLAKEKAEKLFNSANVAIADLCKMSRENFNSSRAVKAFAVGLAITFMAFLFQGVSFMVLANAVPSGSKVGLFDSLMATSASSAVASLPITIGGSGLAELGIWAYISNLNGVFDISKVIKSAQLSVIIAWRIATYHVPLVVSWLALMRLTAGKASVGGSGLSGKEQEHSKSEPATKNSPDGNKGV